MAAFVLIMSGIELCMLPIVGISLLIISKIAAGESGRIAERFFVATLLLATFATMRTMLSGDTLWLVHALTMAILIVGSVSVPSLDRLPAHQSPQAN